ncbi:hypothetical protein FCM35_KLT19752 [Carex littledalei]|uniref:Uncharacterized protein n=1 Tax=Carex littledalei TaxID=544730 RepID=A0A833QSZ1_9POAL|nr:hypothetical protein FCM35_KLT02582 [Carex littledalei]KAF3335245.1 hypothetical protein FCM35_KLT19752 [Carex littledalei]
MLTRNPEAGTQPDVSVPMTVSIAKLKEICSAYNPLQLTSTTEGSYSKQRKEATIPTKSIEKATNKV